jgi:DNA-binding transcriptional MerR regulator
VILINLLLLNQLQQILFYREFGVELTQIKTLLSTACFDAMYAMQERLDRLLKKRQHLNKLIETVEKSLCAMKASCILKSQGS